MGHHGQQSRIRQEQAVCLRESRLSAPALEMITVKVGVRTENLVGISSGTNVAHAGLTMALICLETYFPR